METLCSVDPDSPVKSGFGLSRARVDATLALLGKH